MDRENRAWAKSKPSVAAMKSLTILEKGLDTAGGSLTNVFPIGLHAARAIAPNEPKLSTILVHLNESHSSPQSRSI